MIGQTISHYRILEKLGGGGMGVVYKAEDTKLKRQVALKFLPPELTTDEDAKERFIREAQAASALQHNNICTVHDIDESRDGQIFMVMDLYEGETLKKTIARGPIQPHEAASLTAQIAEGLARAHEKGLVHRDVKPANILVTKAGVVKIVDFGLAKFIYSPQVSREGRRAGTTLYMSPEQLKGEPIDARTDIWSFGVLLYQMLTGIHPFDAEFDESVMYRVITDEPLPVATVQPGVPTALSDLVMHCLQKEKTKRPQSMDEILDALRVLTEVRTSHLTRKRLGRIAAVTGAAMAVAAVGLYLGWDLFFPPPPQTIRIAVLQFVDEPRDTLLQAYKPEMQRQFEGEFVNVHRIITKPLLRLNANIRESFGEENPPRTDRFLSFLRNQTVDYVIDGSITNSPGGGRILQASLVKASSFDPVQVFQGAFASPRQLDSLCRNLARQASAFLRLEILEEKPNLGIWSKNKPANYGALERLYRAYEFYCDGELSAGSAALQEAVALDSTFISPRVWISSYYRKVNPEAARQNQNTLLRLRPAADKFEQAMIDWAGASISYDSENQIRHLRRALGFEPANRILLANLAVPFLEKHDTLRALEAYRYCVTSKWEHKPIYRAAVPLQLSVRWYDSAKVALHNWTQVDTSVHAYSPEMFGWLHALHLRSGELKEAKKWKDRFDMACSDLAGVGPIAFTLGACYADAGMFTEGDSLMQFAISLDSRNAAYHQKYGYVLLQYGKIDTALQELSLAAQLIPPSKGLTLKLGNIYRMKGNIPRAYEYFRKYLQQDSTSYDSRQIQKWIAENHQ
ncbi:MAG: serine/threonine-protein kinase [Ignavibacteriales bacterium]|nr:serine/threonine-protein kinase [Ignavibacteriales bacterium]